MKKPLYFAIVFVAIVILIFVLIQRGYSLDRIVPPLILAGIFIVGIVLVRQNDVLDRIFQKIKSAVFIIFLIWSMIAFVYYVLVGEIPVGSALLLSSPFIFLIVLFIIWFYWGNFLIQLGKPNLAIAHYTNLLRLNPRSPFLYSSRAVLRLHTKDFSGAVDDYGKAIELVRTQKNQFQQLAGVHVTLDLGLLYGSRAKAHIDNDDFEASIMDCDNGLALPNITSLAKSVLHNNRGVALLELPDYEAALADFEDAETVALTLPKPQQAFSLAVIRSQKALALYQLGRKDDAVTIWQNLLRTHPNYRNIQWLKNDLRWRDWQISIVQDLLTLSQQGKSS